MLGYRIRQARYFNNGGLRRQAGLCDNSLDLRDFFPETCMSLTPDDVKTIARLARLSIAEQDIPAWT
jgi:hypothetical protein